MPEEKPVGTEVQPELGDATAPVQPVHSSTTKSKTPLIVGVTIGVVVLAVVAAFAAKSMQKEDTQTTKDTKKDQQQTVKGGNPADANGLVSGDASLALECVPKGHDYYRTNDALTVDPKNADVAYVGVEFKGVYKTSDGGATWTLSDKGVRGYPSEQDASKKCIQEMGRIIVDPQDNTHLLMSRVESPGDLSTLFSENAGVYESKDSGATWAQLLKPGMNASGSRAIAFDPKDSKTIYYGSNNMQPSFGIGGTHAITDYFNDKGILYKTTDGGATWAELPTGAEHGFRAMNVAVDPADSKKLWFFTFSATEDGSTPPEDAQKGAMLSTDTGATWKSFSSSMPTGYKQLVGGMLSPTNGKHAFVITGTTSGAPKSFATTDGGTTWVASNTYQLVAAYDPNDATGMRMLGYAPYNTTPAIMESKDGGVTWNTYATLPANVNDSGKVGGVRISSFAWGTNNKNVVYMSGSASTVWKSTDNGKTWKSVMTLDTVGGKNKNKEGNDISRMPEQ
ncbi:hypothetical protein BH11PAT4_BH11PAT4_5450 [soil metagenome]